MDIYVGNLAYSTNDESLRSAFAAYGEVASARVVSDRMTGLLAVCRRAGLRGGGMRIAVPVSQSKRALPLGGDPRTPSAGLTAPHGEITKPPSFGRITEPPPLGRLTAPPDASGGRG